MKSEEKMYHAITELSDGLIEEAAKEGEVQMPTGAQEKEKTKKPKRSRGTLVMSLIAACLVCALTVGAVVYRLSGRLKGGGTIYADMLLLQVQYPKGYGFSDYEANRENRENYPVKDGFIETVNAFSYKTASELFAVSDGNINYSPVSLYYALATMAEGAQKNTRDEILELLGVSDVEELREQCRNLYNCLYKKNEIGQLEIGSSLWIDKSVSVRQEYVDNLAEHYFTESYQTELSGEEAYKAMSDWVFDRTRGLKLSDAPKDDAAAVFINTVYYYDEWLNKFDKNKTEEDVFYVDKDTEIRCDFMNSRYSAHGFATGDGWVRSSLSLKNTGSMIFVLPDEGVDVYELLSSPERLYEVLNEGEGACGEVVWQIPKFSFGSEMKLKQMLFDLGVEAAFSPSEADFGAMGTVEAGREVGDGAGTENIFVGNISQDTHIAIDENGVEAKAFTRLDYGEAAMPDGRADMVLNRPFLYAITNYRGIVIFVGICTNPALE